MTITSRPATKAFRDNYPFKDKFEAAAAEERPIGQWITVSDWTCWTCPNCSGLDKILIGGNAPVRCRQCGAIRK